MKCKTIMFSVVALSALQTLKATNKSPNIIVILVDDLGNGDLSCQGSASDIHTPNIDKLFNEGIRFTNFYANSTVSSPSRAALLSGKYPDLVGVPGVIRADKQNNWGYLSTNVELLPVVLKREGYQSAIIGKWHLGLENPNLPRTRGFDYFKGFLGDMMDDYYTHLRHGVNYMFENETQINPTGHATDLFTNWAIEFVEEQKDQPFFLYLAYNAPHYPEQPPVQWLQKVVSREKIIDPQRAKLVALIEHLDDNIGRIYQMLEKSGRLENTIIFFASDNGGYLPGGANNLPYSGGKQDMLEGGIHVPGAVYMKGSIEPAIKENMVLLFDFFPTICELAHVTSTNQLDAISILPLLLGETQNTDDRSLVWMRREGMQGYWGQDYYACRKGNFKLLQNNPYEPLVLYNVQTDIKEQYPLNIEEYKSKYTELHLILSEHIRKTGSECWQKK